MIWHNYIFMWEYFSFICLIYLSRIIPYSDNIICGALKSPHSTILPSSYFLSFTHAVRKYIPGAESLYPLNGLTQKGKGTFMPTHRFRVAEYQFKFYNESGLYGALCTINDITFLLPITNNCPVL